MKLYKQICLSMLCATLLVMLAVFPAMAEGVHYDADTDVLTVECVGCIPDGEYALLLLRKGAKPGALISDDILFIDQVTASDGGRIEAVFIDPGFPECAVYAGGDFVNGASSPRWLGDYSPDPGQHFFNAPAALRVIEESAFEGSAFTHVYLGEQVTEIGSRAFADCTGLTYIYIPETTMDIAEDAFDGCGTFTIGCREDSAAHDYAIDHGFNYRLVTN